MDRLENWSGRNLMIPNKKKSQVLHLKRNNPKYQYTLGTNSLESSFAGKGLDSPGAQQAEHEPAVCPYSKGGHQCPRLL